jgi:peroxiredoxin
MRRLILPVAALALVAMIGISYAGECQGGAQVGSAAPGFSLQDQNGNSVSLEQFKGKIVVLEWFNNECPFVVKFYKNGDMNKWAAAYAEKGVVWLAINSTNGKTNEDNASIAGEWGIERPILNDSEGTIGHAYGAKTTPHMYVVNADGVLVYMGAIDSVKSTDSDDIADATNHVAAALDELLAGTSVSVSETNSYGCSVKYKK